LALPTNTRLGWKGLRGTETLAYCRVVWFNRVTRPNKKGGWNRLNSLVKQAGRIGN